MTLSYFCSERYQRRKENATPSSSAKWFLELGDELEAGSQADSDSDLDYTPAESFITIFVQKLP